MMTRVAKITAARASQRKMEAELTRPRLSSRFRALCARTSATRKRRKLSTWTARVLLFNPHVWCNGNTGAFQRRGRRTRRLSTSPGFDSRHVHFFLLRRATNFWVPTVLRRCRSRCGCDKSLTRDENDDVEERLREETARSGGTPRFEACRGFKGSSRVGVGRSVCVCVVAMYFPCFLWRDSVHEGDHGEVAIS